MDTQNVRLTDGQTEQITTIADAQRTTAQSFAANAEPVGGSGGGGSEEECLRAGVVESMLRRIGVTGRRAKALAASGKTNPMGLVEAWAEHIDSCPPEHLPGRLVRMVEDGDAPPTDAMSWGAFAKAIMKPGSPVQGVNGLTVGEVQFKDDGGPMRLVRADDGRVIVQYSAAIAVKLA